MASQLSSHIQCHRLSCNIYSLQYCIEVVTIIYLRLSGGLAILWFYILMHSGVIGSCDVIGVEFPNSRVLGDVFLTLGAHAQRGLQYSFCLSVSQSVCLFTTILGNEAASERYQQLQRNKRSKIKQAILLKRRRSRSRNWRTALRDPAHQLGPFLIIILRSFPFFSLFLMPPFVLFSV